MDLQTIALQAPGDYAAGRISAAERDARIARYLSAYQDAPRARAPKPARAAVVPRAPKPAAPKPARAAVVPRAPKPAAPKPARAAVVPRAPKPAAPKPAPDPAPRAPAPRAPRTAPPLSPAGRRVVAAERAEAALDAARAKLRTASGPKTIARAEAAVSRAYARAETARAAAEVAASAPPPKPPKPPKAPKAPPRQPGEPRKGESDSARRFRAGLASQGVSGAKLDAAVAAWAKSTPKPLAGPSKATRKNRAKEERQKARRAAATSTALATLPPAPTPGVGGYAAALDRQVAAGQLTRAQADAGLAKYAAAAAVAARRKEAVRLAEEARRTALTPNQRAKEDGERQAALLAKKQAKTDKMREKRKETTAANRARSDAAPRAPGRQGAPVRMEGSALRAGEKGMPLMEDAFSAASSLWDKYERSTLSRREGTLTSVKVRDGQGRELAIPDEVSAAGPDAVADWIEAAAADDLIDAEWLDLWADGVDYDDGDHYETTA